MTPSQEQKPSMTAGKSVGLKFGDIVINHWAGEKNPHRKGIVVRIDPKSIYCTDGNGDFWNVVNDKGSKTEKIGTILSEPKASKEGWIDVSENETELVKYLHESIKESEAVYGPIKRVLKYGGSIFAIYEGGKCYRLNWQSYNQDIVTLD